MGKEVLVRKLPKPGQLKVMIDELRILLISGKVNGLTRRVQSALSKYPVTTNTVETVCPKTMETAVQQYKPDMIICPFLTAKIPDNLYKDTNRPCLIVHPGIAGDRGASSIDWAIHKDQSDWGVTVLQASDVMDGGDIWSTDTFPVPDGSTKTSLYVGGVTDTAVKCVLDAVSRFCQSEEPVPLNYSDPNVVGRLQRNTKKIDRTIDWKMSSAEIVRRVRMSDTQPGAIAELRVGNDTHTYRLFDAFREVADFSSPNVKRLLEDSEPGDIVAERHKSLLIKAGDSDGVWIGQLKQDVKGLSLKLPALEAVHQQKHICPQTILEPCCNDDVKSVKSGDVYYVQFDFYNGAMDTQQAARLQRELEYAATLDDVKVIALLGGDRFFSTGIHLNVIENSNYKQLEAWKNINAINDVIKTVVSTKNKATVAVLQGNAGAGGAMFAAACDLVISHPGVLLTPSYRSMNLYGSEYWTYFLPKRVGHKTATELTNETTPISAEEAARVGLIDHVIDSDKITFKADLPNIMRKISSDGTADDLIRKKKIERDSDWFRLIQWHRDFELSQMRRNFRSSEFLTAMNKFVYKIA